MSSFLTADHTYWQSKEKTMGMTPVKNTYLHSSLFELILSLLILLLKLALLLPVAMICFANRPVEKYADFI